MIKKTVGFIALANTKDGGLVAALQVRGNYNIEKDNQETYNGACQITVHGSIAEEENQIDALMRETREELGEEFAEIIESKKDELVEINRIENENIAVVNYAIVVDGSDLDKIELDESTGGYIKLITKDDVENICELKPSDRSGGIKTESKIAMFPDDVEAVRLAFSNFS